MNKYLKIKKSFLLRLLIFVAAVGAIFLALPGGGNSEFSYEVNKPWGYDDLKATFDVPIRLDDDRRKAVEDSLAGNFVPIYKINDDAFKEVRGILRGCGITESGSPELYSALGKIYAQGVIAPEQESGAALTKINVSKPSGRRGYAESSFSTVDVSTLVAQIDALSYIESIIKSDTALLNNSELRLADIVRPNVERDAVMSDSIYKSELQRATANIGVIPTGQLIVSRAERISPQTFTNIATYQEMLKAKGQMLKSSANYSRLGALAMIVILMVVFFGYLAIYRPKLYNDLRSMQFLTLLVVSFTVLAFVLNASFTKGIYMVPFTIIPIVVVVFLDSRTAFFTYLIAVLMSTAMTHYMWDFIAMQFVAGFVAVISINELSKRSQLIRSAVLIFLAYAVTYVAVEVMQTGSFDNLSSRMFGSLAINAVLISFAYILIFVFEKMFGFISRVTLVELSDINNPLLRELSEECPGTFQHSMAVSNIAAAAASRVGANAQLVRTGALYHDLGKMSNPAFFTENQHGVNPHDALTPVQSAKIVIGHVIQGLKRAEKVKLPHRLRDFIAEHHGRGTARFFYTTYCNSHPGETVDPEPFTYPGPNPRSMETSLLMMADAVEAASRSLKDHSEESIRNLVDRIIDAQVAEGLHNDSPISFRDISEIKKSFASTLRTMYHSRISYPSAVRPAAPQDVPPSGDAS